MWSTYTMEYYSASKGKELWTHVTTCMKHEDMMFSEVSHSQKDKHCMSPLI